MPIEVNGTVTVPTAQLMAVEQYRMQLVSDLSEVRLALGVLGEEVAGVSGEAFLRLVEGRLRDIERRADSELGKLPEWLTRQI